MTNDAIAFRDVTKRYGKHPVLNGLDFSVKAGECFGLVGVNGAGKTTLIKSLLDFCAIDGGEIVLFGTRHHETESRRELAFLPERFTPPYYLTGRDFLAYLLKLHGIAFNAEKTAAMLEALDLEPTTLNRPARTYSKGMSQKLGLAACFLSGKRLLILDEPMSGLDPKARALVKRYLLHLKSAGHTLFFSTHALPDVEELCDRMAILHGGTVRFVGTPAECRARFDGGTLERAFLNCIT